LTENIFFNIIQPTRTCGWLSWCYFS